MTRALILWIAAFALGSTLLVAQVTGVHPTRDHVIDYTPTRVLIARKLILKGTPGPVIVSKKLYAKTRFPHWEVGSDALSHRQDLVGRAASHDLFPGKQLTTLDFSAK